VSRRVLASGVGGAGVVFGLVSAWLAGRPHGLSFAAVSPLNTLLALGGGWMVITSGLIAWARRPASRFGPLLAITGLAWFVTDWATPGTGSALVFTMGLALAGAAAPLVAHALLVYPAGRLRHPAERLAVAFGYAANLLVVGLLPTLLYAPVDSGCSTCPANLLVIRSAPDLAATIGRLGLLLAVVWALVTIVILSRRLLRATAPARVVALPVFAPGIAFIALWAIDALHNLPVGSLGIDRVDTTLWQGRAISLVALGVGERRWPHSSVTRISCWPIRSGTTDSLTPTVTQLRRIPDPADWSPRLSATAKSLHCWGTARISQTIRVGWMNS
jgi:hypothetical protein